MSADSALELAKLLIDHPHIAEAMKGMAVVHNTYNGPTTVYIGCSFGGNGGGGNKSPSSKGRKNRRPTVTLETSLEDEEVAQEDDEDDEEDTSPTPTSAPAPASAWGSVSDATPAPTPAPAEAPQMGYQEAIKIWARLDRLSNDGEIDEEVPSVTDLKVAHPNWITAFSVADDQLNAVIAAFNAGPDLSSPPF